MASDITSNTNFWKALKGFVSVLTILVALLAIVQIKQLFWGPSAHVQTTPNTITVSGTGDAFSSPDVATFSFQVTQTAAAIKDAQTAATTKTNAAIQAMLSSGVASSDIQTTAYNINPHYEYTNGVCTSGGICTPSKSTITGYDVSQTIQVKTHDLSNAGTLLQQIGSLGVQNVDSLQFSIDKPDALQDQARTAAINDAKTKAQALASELGVNIVRIVNFSENTGGGIQPIMYSTKAMGMVADAVAPAPSLPSGQQKITSDVSITYEIR